MGPPLLFFAAYLWLRDQTFTIGGTEYGGFIVAAAVFVPILLTSIALLWKLTGKLSRMQVFTAVLVVVFGGLTVWFNDEKFFKVKTTIVYGVFTGILGLGLLQGRSYLAWVMSEFLPLRDEGWMILTRRLTALFAVLALGNELVWRTMSTDAWVKIETFRLSRRALRVSLEPDHDAATVSDRGRRRRAPARRLTPRQTQLNGLLSRRRYSSPASRGYLSRDPETEGSSGGTRGARPPWQPSRNSGQMSVRKHPISVAAAEAVPVF